MDKAKRDEVVLVETDDPDMAAAFRKAREPCPSSWPSPAAPQSTANKLAVKIAIPDGDGNEYFWLTQFAQRGDRYTRAHQQYAALGQASAVWASHRDTEAKIIDWLLVEGGKMRGTACAMLKREPPDQLEAAKEQYGLSCAS